MSAPGFYLTDTSQVPNSQLFSLPLAFYLKLFDHEITARERTLCWSVMVFSLMISVIGTVWAFLPKQLIGAK